MARELLISLGPPGRIAILEEGRLGECVVHPITQQGGTIYKGRVMALEPALEAAFVDIGSQRHAFLHLSDVPSPPGIIVPPPQKRTSLKRPRSAPQRRIQDCLASGQEILVQLVKPARNRKGPVVSMYISIPGRFLVLAPAAPPGVFFSRRISEPKERGRLTEILKTVARPRSLGVIVQQSALQASRRELTADLARALSLWTSLVDVSRSVLSPTVLYEEDVVTKALREMYDPTIDVICLDEPTVVDRARKYLHQLNPKTTCRVEVYERSSAMFDLFGVERELARLHEPEVPLPHGAQLRVKKLEDVWFVDVTVRKPAVQNTTEQRGLEINVMAAEEMGRQVRLRNMEGLILCDFMEPLGRKLVRQRVDRALAQAMKRDRGQCTQLPMSGLGIIEMYRRGPVSSELTALHFHSCFISYSSKDEEFAQRLHTDLQNRGVRCWFAPHDIHGGRKIHEQIDAAIRGYDKVVLVLSAHSMQSEWVKTEIANARQREIQDNQHVLFPLRLVDYETIRAWKCFDADTGKDSAREIREYFIPDFSHWDDDTHYRPAFDRLLRDLQKEEEQSPGDNNNLDAPHSRSS